MARLVENEYLANIPMITEVKGSVTNRIAQAIAKGGLQPNEENKNGIAILIMTPRGRADQGGTRSVSPQSSTLRLAIFVKPLLNDGVTGLQKPPLTVHYEAMKQMISWDLGPGQDPIQLLEWDSDETPSGELTFFADYEVPQFINV